MDPSQQMLLFCQTGVYDCAGSTPAWASWTVGAVAALTIIGAGVLAYLASRG